MIFNMPPVGSSFDGPCRNTCGEHQRTPNQALYGIVLDSEAGVALLQRL